MDGLISDNKKSKVDDGMSIVGVYAKSNKKVITYICQSRSSSDSQKQCENDSVRREEKRNNTGNVSIKSMGKLLHKVHRQVRCK